jgi:hypothetical protein
MSVRECHKNVKIPTAKNRSEAEAVRRERHSHVGGASPSVFSAKRGISQEVFPSLANTPPSLPALSKIASGTVWPRVSIHYADIDAKGSENWLRST